MKTDLVPAYRRPLFPELAQTIPVRQITALVGLRRTGKSTLFFQLIDHLLEKGIPPTTILYFSFDEHVEHLDELLNAFQKQVFKKNFDEQTVFVFLDEVQKLDDWQN
ncbi:MAG TPA: AAA family ATPase, partial [Candidatus Norongarragalinales archaeon]|nr:AAA family ATPase [Candidatus Norongarragalinales archaeon]